MQTSPDINEQNPHGMSSTGESSPEVPPKTPSISQVSSSRPLYFRKIKRMTTMTMIEDAIEEISSPNSRKGFSFAKLRNYILKKFLDTPTEARARLPIVKKIFKNALESGDVVHVKGTGLMGSFRVPGSSVLHKNAKRNEREVKKSSKVTKETLKKRAIAKPKKVK